MLRDFNKFRRELARHIDAPPATALLSLETSSICVIDGSGKIVREAKVGSEPAALIAGFGSLGSSLTRIGLEAGSCRSGFMRRCVTRGLRSSCWSHVHTAKIMPVTIDRKDARGIAELMRLGWFRPVHCKSTGAQETRC